MRVLYLTTLLPGMRRTGSEVASQSFIDALRALGSDVTVLAYRRAGTAPPQDRGDVAVADRHIETEGAGLRPAFWMARALLTRQPYTAVKFATRGYRRAVARELAERPPQLIVLDHARMGWLVPRGGWDVPFVLIAHNAEHRLYAGLAASGGLRRWANAREAGRVRGLEERLCRAAREVWTLTSDDAEALRGLGARATRALGLPPTGVPAPPGAAAHDVAVLGGWHWKANAAGLRWFAAEVLPRLELDVRIGGASADKVVGAPAGATVVGPVPDALEFLQSARVVAVPSVSGAGVQVKTLDAIASGRRVVATPVAMRGIADPPPTVRVAEDGAAFAAALRDAASAGADGAAAGAALAWAADRARRFRDEVGAALAEATR